MDDLKSVVLRKYQDCHTLQCSLLSIEEVEESHVNTLPSSSLRKFVERKLSMAYFEDWWKS
jgi:hypothetical protein